MQVCMCLRLYVCICLYNLWSLYYQLHVHVSTGNHLAFNVLCRTLFQEKLYKSLKEHLKISVIFTMSVQYAYVYTYTCMHVMAYVWRGKLSILISFVLLCVSLGLNSSVRTNGKHLFPMRCFTDSIVISPVWQYLKLAYCCYG